MRSVPGGRRLRWLGAVSGVAVFVALGWVLWPSPPPPVAVPPPPPAEFHIATADEATIRADVPSGLTIFRLAANPRIVVLDFASLRDQGLMLDRIAALTEKAMTPRDEVLDDARLDQAIRAHGDSIETFYYGHDYSAAELTRFFAMAAQQHIQLNAGEETLGRLLMQLGWFATGTQAALITVPKAGADEAVTGAMRNAILRHELSHGEYFSNPVYAAYVHQFWLSALVPAEQAAIRRFLADGEYDSSIDALTENEMQAYLMFSPGVEFFAPAQIGMTATRLTELRAAFLNGMPAGWLHDALAQAAP